MSALARVGVLVLILAAALAPPPAAASDCIQVMQLDWGEGLRVIANTGRQIALGLVSEMPGDGQGIIVIITPSVCGPLGVGLTGNDSTHEIEKVPSYLPLP